jgi:hypothetical protein
MNPGDRLSKRPFIKQVPLSFLFLPNQIYFYRIRKTKEYFIARMAN